METATRKTPFGYIFHWGIESTGYTPRTDIWTKLSSADVLSIMSGDTSALTTLLDSITKSVQNLQYTIEVITETVMAINWKSFQHYDEHRDLARTYNRYYKFLDKWCMDNLKDEDLSYYLSTTD